MIKILLILLCVTNIFADFYALQINETDLNKTAGSYHDIINIQYYDNHLLILNKKFKTLDDINNLKVVYDTEFNTTILKIKDYKMWDSFEIITSIKSTESVQSKIRDFDLNKVLKNIKIPESFLRAALSFLIYIMGFIVFFVIFYKIIHEEQAKKMTILRTRLKDEISDSIDMNSKINFNPIKDYEYIAVIDGCINVITKLMRDEDYSSIKPIHRYLESINAFEFLYNKIKNPFVIGKVEFIERLGLTLYENNKFFLFFVIAQNGTKKNRINEHAIAGLSYLVNRFDLQFFLSYVVNLKSSGKFLEFIFTNVLKNLIANKHHSGIAYILTELYKIENNTILIKSFVEAIGFIEYGQLRNELCDLYHMTLNDNIKTTVIRTLGKLVSNKEIETLLFLGLIDKTPLIRITAAKSLMNTNLDGHEEELISALSDPVYHVRLNVALSLSNSDFGRSILEYVVETSKDKFSKDMAHHALIVYKRFNENKAVLNEQEVVEFNDYI